MRWLIMLVLAASAPQGAVMLEDSSMFETVSGSTAITCGYVSGRWVSGRFYSQTSLFLPHSAQIRNLKRKLNSASGASRSKIQTNLTRISALASKGRKVCAAGPGGSSPTPAPTPPASFGNFDSAGNVTAAGKVIFGIPANLSANITTGKNTNNLYCVGCHTEKTGLLFANYREKIAEAPMLYDEIQVPDVALANITAYLNRFRAN